MDSNFAQGEIVSMESNAGDHEQHPEASKKLAVLINCAICLGSLRAPIKILACGHSYCYRCLIGLKQVGNRGAASNGRRFIRCPTCRQETLLPRGLVKLLPTNYMLQHLLAAMNPPADEAPFNEQLEMTEEASVAETRSGVYALLIGDVTALEAIVASVMAMTSSTFARGDWNCPSCNYYNYAFRTYCRWCPSPCPRLRPRIEIGYIDDASIFDQIQLLASISSGAGG